MQAILEKDKDTICAVSTPPGHGGIAVLRVSGEKAGEIARKICSHLPETLESHKVYFTKIIESSSQQTLDEALVTFFSNGRSYTGEETVEISCHGSQFLSQKILNELIKAGSRLAEKGEFTYRAYMNNKIDLIQAESVLNLIQSQSHRSSNQAIRQLQGELSSKIVEIEQELLLIGAHLEAQIDFVEQDIEPEDQAKLIRKMDFVAEAIEELLKSFNHGRLLKEGVQVLFLGQPNVGKSSLLNALLSEDKAIVTDIPGTTRDIVSGSKLINGVEIRFIDTAGVRASENIIEKMGIEKTLQAIKNADIVFILLDATCPQLPEINREDIADKKVHFIFNKSDKLNSDDDFSRARDMFSQVSINLNSINNEEILFISALEKKGLELLEQKIADFINKDHSENSIAVVSSRQYENLKLTNEFLLKAKDQLLLSASPEFAAFEIKNAAIEIHKLLGKEYDDQIMDKVFSEFCLGK